MLVAKSFTEPECNQKVYVNEKKSHNIIGNRNHNLLACSAVPEQTALLCVPPHNIYVQGVPKNYIYISRDVIYVLLSEVELNYGSNV